MFGQITAVAIDDEPSHLLSITTGLSASGIACTGYWYDRNSHELSPPVPDGGFPSLRLIFMDLNLEELGGNPEPANLAGTVINVLKRVVAPKGGPYLLIFWTQVSGKVDQVRELLFERIQGIPLPLDVLAIPKGQFIISSPKGTNFPDALKQFYIELHENIGTLKSAVDVAVATNPQLAAVSQWESRAAEAAGRAVNEVYACAADDAMEPKAVSESLRNILVTIAREASGPRPASEAPARALDIGMADILFDQFGASVDVASYAEVVKRAIGQALLDTVSSNIEFNNSAIVAANLNTFFHVDKEVSSVQTWDRGVVIPAKPPLDKNLLGFAPRELLTSEFLFPIELIPKAKHEVARALLAEYNRNADFVLVELGADCDHAQNTQRTRRYLLGLEIPEADLWLARFHENEKLRNESLQLLGPWVVDSNVRYLLVSCRRFWAWQKSSPPPIASKVRYRLRSSVVSKLLYHYSAWHSRPGIVAFRA